MLPDTADGEAKVIYIIALWLSDGEASFFPFVERRICLPETILNKNVLLCSKPWQYCN